MNPDLMLQVQQEGMMFFLMAVAFVSAVVGFLAGFLVKNFMLYQQLEEIEYYIDCLEEDVEDRFAQQIPEFDEVRRKIFG